MTSILMDLAVELERKLGLSRSQAISIAHSRLIELREEHLPSDHSIAGKLDDTTARNDLVEFLDRLDSYPNGRYGGRGIVLCAGGTRYLGLHQHASPHGLPPSDRNVALRPLQLDTFMTELVKPLDVTTVDALAVRKRHPIRLLLGYAIKPYALLHSSFEEVLLLDADNVPLTNVEILFDEPAFRETRALFWPDETPISASNPIWTICHLPYREEASFESGQMLIAKGTAWRALNLAVHMNAHSDYFYQYLQGDKDCFQIAWRIACARYSLIPYPMKRLSGAMCQHDSYGRRVFQHRNDAKWDRDIQRIPGFVHEDECLALLDELDKRWDGRIAKQE
jgi:Mannosyltransferase putative